MSDEVTPDPDRGKFTLDPEDGQPPFVLWYTAGALRRLEESFGKSVTLSDLAGGVFEWLPLVSGKTLATFIWAGRQWEDRALKPEKVQERLDRALKPPSKIADEVGQALFLGVTGETAQSWAARMAKAVEEAQSRGDSDPPKAATPPSPIPGRSLDSST